MAGLTPMTALGTAQPQTPNGTAVNASMALGLPGLGANLQDDMAQKMKDMRKGKILLGSDGNPTAYGSPLLGASQSLFGTPSSPK